jgi:hypothetical protein
MNACPVMDELGHNDDPNEKLLHRLTMQLWQPLPGDACAASVPVVQFSVAKASVGLNRAPSLRYCACPVVKPNPQSRSTWWGARNR